jgi:hypothetical protein
MKVRAIKLGYYEHIRRRVGDVFELIPLKDSKGKTISIEQQFSDKWMEKVAKGTPEKSTGAQAALNAEQASLKAFKSNQEVI